MKKLNTALILALFPLVAQAAPYTYDCEPDSNGVEALCLALPDGQAEQTPQAKQAAKPAPVDGKDRRRFPTELVYGGAMDANLSGANATRPGVSPKSQSSSSALSAMRSQEKVRQVEDFLRSAKAGEPVTPNNQ